ncbi:hypothetical protein PR048_007274 [Dryococelus australis]|uniref:Uncharacterized protein n=1 Tax=Dryococelus australis TaxID=614101 RepID=A0ABQ9IEF8_9NEOP|nr:hypothetical protein PR048_007274 [Dryococelus australis]
MQFQTGFISLQMSKQGTVKSPGDGVSGLPLWNDNTMGSLPSPVPSKNCSEERDAESCQFLQEHYDMAVERVGDMVHHSIIIRDIQDMTNAEVAQQMKNDPKIAALIHVLASRRWKDCTPVERLANRSYTAVQMPVDVARSAWSIFASLTQTYPSLCDRLKPYLGTQRLKCILFQTPAAHVSKMIPLTSNMFGRRSEISACSQLGTRIIPRVSRSQSLNVCAHIKGTARQFRLCEVIYSAARGHGRPCLDAPDTSTLLQYSLCYLARNAPVSSRAQLNGLPTILAHQLHLRGSQIWRLLKCLAVPVTHRPPASECFDVSSMSARDVFNEANPSTSCNENPPSQTLTELFIGDSDFEDYCPEAESLPEFRKWEYCRTMPLVGGFSLGSSVCPSLAFQRCSILNSFHPHRLSRPYAAKRTQNCDPSPAAPLTRAMLHSPHSTEIEVLQQERYFTVHPVDRMWPKHVRLPLAREAVSCVLSLSVPPWRELLARDVSRGGCVFD